MKMHFFQVQPGERQLSALPQWLWGQSLQRQWRDFLFLPWDIRKLQKLRVIFQQLWAKSVHEWSRTQWCCPSTLWRWARSSSHVHIVSAYASFFKALYFLRPRTCASDVSSSEVLDPSCCCQFWACGSTDSGHYRLVSTGECQPPGNSQSGGRFSQVV